MKISCEIIQDLIPLVNDHVASEESRKLVQEHCQSCKECRKLLVEDLSFDSQKIDLKWKKKIRISMIGFIVLLALIACLFTETENMFSNILILPIIGGLSYGLLKKKIYMIYILLLVIQLFVQLFSLNFHYGFIIYVGIYYVLMTMGALIYYCFNYALTGGKKYEG